jgi:hypothetical protein
VISITGNGRAYWHESCERWGMTMRKLFILVALAFALVTAATATVVATTPYAEASITDAR